MLGGTANEFAAGCVSACSSGEVADFWPTSRTVNGTVAGVVASAHAASVPVGDDFFGPLSDPS